MTINLKAPSPQDELRPNITVIGVGGAGGNAVNNMIKANLEGANFVVANTDAQALEYALTDSRVQLGINVTQGLGAGASPDVGRAAAEEAIEELEQFVRGSNMVFITAGMGGGTGTGAAPVVARMAREMGVLTVGVVTKPFHFEGTHRMRLAEQGLEELQKFVDTLIVIPNQNLFRIANEKTTFADAFAMADDVLHSGVRGITDLMTMPGLINLDFADIRSVMSEMGKAMMGTGEAEGDRRALEAAEAAISNPLLDDVSMKGARGVLINVTGGLDLTLFEVDEAANRIRDEVDPEANIIFGAIFDEKMQGSMRVSVVATGVDVESAFQAPTHHRPVQQVQPRSVGGNVASRPQRSENVAKESASVQEGAASAASKARGREATPQVRTAIPTKKMSDKEPAPVAKKVEVAKRESQEVMEEVEEAQSHIAPSKTAKPRSEGGKEGDFFIAPKAAEPAVRPVENTKYRKAPEARVVSEEDEREVEGNRSNFFQRMGKALTAKAGMDDEVEPKVETTSKKRQEVKEDYLDIPAFLRRQAN